MDESGCSMKCIDLHDRERMYWQLPRQVIQKCDIQNGMHIVDLGCGNGYFTFYLSEYVGKTGIVYALDTQESFLRTLREKTQTYRMDTIIAYDPYEAKKKIPSNSIDCVFIINTLHLIYDAVDYAAFIQSILNDNGRICVVQWSAEKMEKEMLTWESNNKQQFSLKSTYTMLKKINLKVIRKEAFLPMQDLYICRIIK